MLEGSVKQTLLPQVQIIQHPEKKLPRPLNVNEMTKWVSSISEGQSADQAQIKAMKYVAILLSAHSLL